MRLRDIFNNRDYYIRLEKEKAFREFIIIQNRKEEFEVLYYSRRGRDKNLDFSFIGYITSKEGFFGIHYFLKRDYYYFGTFDKITRETPMRLNYKDSELVPELWKKALKKVASTRLELILFNKK